MIRGTTPTLKLPVKGVEVKDLNSIYLTIKQGNHLLTRREDEIEKDEENNALVMTLTQAETLSFNEGMLSLQLRATVGLDSAVASNIVTTTLDCILMEGEIE